PHDRIVLYPQQSCGNAAPDWVEPYVAIGGAGFPGGRLFFPVRLDGRRILAFIDTGAQMSTLSATTARTLGVTDAALSRDRPVTLRGIAAEQLGARAHHFSRLEIGNAVIEDPEFVVADVTFRNSDIILGADFISL